MLRVLNSLTRTKEEFKPLDPDGKRVGMYVCGPTVYNHMHLGNARTFTMMDVVRRYLEYKGYQVRYVQNFTDVDDKILKRALAENRDWREVAATYTDAYHKVAVALGIRPADVHPRATDHIPEMLEILRRLFERGHAYAAQDGDVYFDTSSFARYGRLSGRKLDEEEAGLSGRIAQARLAVKKHPGDFILWKLNKNDQGELANGGAQVPHWPSPWGDGRPGWHLECSAMSQRHLGVPFDFHGGAQDLLFPHHEDEKAQTECAFHDLLGERESVRYWLHGAFLNAKARPEDERAPAAHVDRAGGGVKMSKSLGNVQWPYQMIWPEGPCDPMAVRMLYLGSHYRSPIVFEPTLLDEATAKLDRIYNALEAAGRALGGAPPTGAVLAEGTIARAAIAARAAFEAAMDDDFNSAGALAALFDLVNAMNQELARHPGGAPPAVALDLSAGQQTLEALLGVLGVRPYRVQGGGGDASSALVELLMRTRQDARQVKQFALADQVRNQLLALGYDVEDLPGGKWNVKKK